jgi:hypothetical protein
MSIPRKKMRGNYYYFASEVFNNTTSLVLLQILKLTPASFYDFAIYLIIWIKVPFFIFQENIKSGSKAKSNRGYITTSVKGHQKCTVWYSGRPSATKGSQKYKPSHVQRKAQKNFYDYDQFELFIQRHIWYFHGWYLQMLPQILWTTLHFTWLQK